MLAHQRLVGLLCFGLVACGQAAQSSAPLPPQRTLEQGNGCAPGYYFTTDSSCALKVPGNTPGPGDTAAQDFSSGCVSGESDPNHYCITPSFGDGDCDNSAQCEFVLDTLGRAAGCEPTAHTCSVSGCGPGSYVGPAGPCHDKLPPQAPVAVDATTPEAGCVSGAVNGGVCAAPATGAGDCWFDDQCKDVATANADTIGCMANHACGPTVCDPGYYVTENGTCALKATNTGAPRDSLIYSLGGQPYDACVSGIGDPNTYCVTPSFGAGDCAFTSQCAGVVDGDGRDAGCSPQTHQCSVPGCGAGAYVGADGLCHDKVASGTAAPADTQDGNPADGCVSGSLFGVACAATATGSGDCWDAAQCPSIQTDHASGMGCMANRHCGPTACDPGYYVTGSGTCSLKASGWTPSPRDSLTWTLGGQPYDACVSGIGDANTYCVPPSFGSGDCALDSQCANVFASDTPQVLCDPSSHSCSVCQNGTYLTTGAACGDKRAGGMPAPADTFNGDPGAGCVSGAVDSNFNCTAPTPGSGDCYSDTQCSGVASAGASSITCASHTCAVSACFDGLYLSNGACSVCTICPPGQRRLNVCGGSTNATCVACAPGTFAADPNADNCDMCPADTYSAPNATECISCDPGAHAQPGSNACTHCDLGSAYENGTCTSCDAGSYAADGDTTCTPCDAGTYSSAGAALVPMRAIPVHTRRAVRARASLCAPDTYASSAGTGECLPCPGGTHAPRAPVRSPAPEMP